MLLLLCDKQTLCVYDNVFHLLRMSFRIDLILELLIDSDYRQNDQIDRSDIPDPCVSVCFLIPVASPSVRLVRDL